MALIGLVRVSTDKQKTQRQHDALDPICWRVFEEKASGKLATADRPDLLTALSYIREGDLLTVQEVDRLGRNLLEGLIVLNDLFHRGVGVKVLEGIAAGEHTERSFLTWPSRSPRTGAATSSGRPSAASMPPVGKARSAAAAPSSTTTSAPRSSTAADAANPSAPSPPGLSLRRCRAQDPDRRRAGTAGFIRTGRYWRRRVPACAQGPRDTARRRPCRLEARTARGTVIIVAGSLAPARAESAVPTSRR